MTERERLIELIEHEIDVKNAGINTEWLADYLLENGMIVPPCKVGDNVYWIDNEKIKSCEVFEISIHSDGILIHTGIQFCLKPDAVYYTKEEAEKALHKINHNSLCETETYKMGANK